MADKLLIVVTFFVLVAWAMLMVAAADGPYAGWMKQKVSNAFIGTRGYRLGWKGYQQCDSDYANCDSGTSYDSSTCYVSAMKTAEAFAIMAVIFGFPVLVSCFLHTFKLGPPFYHFSLGTIVLSFATSIFSFFGWVVCIGRVVDCVSGSTPDFDHNPPFLIVAQVIYMIAGFVQLRARGSK